MSPIPIRVNPKNKTKGDGGLSDYSSAEKRREKRKGKRKGKGRRRKREKGRYEEEGEKGYVVVVRGGERWLD